MSEKRKIWRVKDAAGNLEQVYVETTADLVAIDDTDVETKIGELEDAIEEAGKVDGETIGNSTSGYQSVTLTNKILTIEATSKYNPTNNKVVLQNELNAKADKSNITGATKTKITYNSQGIVTAGADAGIADISGLQAALNAKVNITDIVNNTTSTDTNKPLSANMGKSLSDRINNLDARGKFLALWDATTGKPTSDPTELPYTYHTGDYFIVTKVGSSNKMPDGATYTGAASTKAAPSTLAVNDAYYYDGTNWDLQENHIDLTTFVTQVSYDATSAELHYTVNGTALTVQNEGTTNDTKFVNSVDGMTGVVNLEDKYMQIGDMPDVTVVDEDEGNFISDISASGHTITVSRDNVTIPSVTIATATGNGNVITGLTANGHTITPAKGITALTENQTITLSGDVTGSGKTSITTTIANNSISSAKLATPTSGTSDVYTAFTKNSKGQVVTAGKSIEWGTSGQSTPSEDLMVGGLFFELVS